MGERNKAKQALSDAPRGEFQLGMGELGDVAVYNKIIERVHENLSEGACMRAEGAGESGGQLRGVR
ncbi:hypothetical protein L484_019784 [Morus notabilis]|uniref:Uncharacterized protein n=1 Tax=Morus notabilis TaxID=981085 RepID=W9S4D0_9ROSA|nr:hypothetical protein L484_019784 [Morus notabilis]